MEGFQFFEFLVRIIEASAQKEQNYSPDGIEVGSWERQFSFWVQNPVDLPQGTDRIDP